MEVTGSPRLGQEGVGHGRGAEGSGLGKDCGCSISKRVLGLFPCRGMACCFVFDEHGGAQQDALPAAQFEQSQCAGGFSLGGVQARDGGEHVQDPFGQVEIAVPAERFEAQAA